MKIRIILLMTALLWGFLPLAEAAGWDLNGVGLPAVISQLRDGAAALPSPLPLMASSHTLICVDPGHPNTYNDGFTPVNGTNETRINWQVALKLEKILKEKGFEVLMTKSSEKEYVENKDRALMANNGGAALAVHLHCESTPGSGFTIYYPDREGTYEYKDDPDNGFKGPSKDVMAGSLTFAQAMSKGMAQGLSGGLTDLGVKGDSKTKVGSSQGALTFSIFSKVPTITIEMAVLTNQHDANFIKSEAGQEKMAQAIASGILLYQAP